MSDQGAPQPDAGTPAGGVATPVTGWIFPLREAIATTRYGLLAAGVAFGLTTSVLLGLLWLVLALIAPETVAAWSPAAFLPFAACCLAAWRWNPVSAVQAILLGLMVTVSIAILAFAIAQAAVPDPAGTAAYALRIPVIATILVATSTDRWSGGAAGALVGYVLAEGTALLTGAVLGLAVRFDLPAFAVLVGSVLLSGFFPIARARSRGRTGPLEAADRRARAARIRDLERRELVAQLHDTVLSDLTAIAIRRPGAFSASERAELEAGLATSALLPALRSRGSGVIEGLEAVAAAGGLELLVEGDIDELERLPAATRAVMASALEQCVVNVARHARTESVRLRAVARAGEIELFVEDDGVGFDPGSVSDDRLGLSESIQGRIEREGGHVEVRSSPGAGTLVAIRLPRGGTS